MARKGRIIEGFWNCQYCGSKKIRGGLRECPNCGKARGLGTNFDMDRANPNYVEPEVAKTISRNPDWLCSFCEQLNSDNDCNCISCGASKEDSEKNYFQIKAEREAKERAIKEAERQQQEEYESYTSDLMDEILEEVEDDNNNDYESSYASTNAFYSSSCEGSSISPLESVGSFIGSIVSHINPMAILGVLGSILLIAGFIWLLMPKEDTLTVSNIQWERSISIQEERTVKEDGWSVPAGGRTYRTASEIHHYDQVLDHYETVTVTKTREVLDHYEDYVSGYRDLGNGYFEEIISSRPVYRTETYTETEQEPVYVSVPVYQTKYYYEIEKWFTCRSVDTSGNDKNPYWGEVILGEKEREGSKSQTYSIIATNEDGEVNTYNLDFSQWEEIEIGDVLTVKVYLFNRIEILDKNGEVISETE